MLLHMALLSWQACLSIYRGAHLLHSSRSGASDHGSPDQPDLSAPVTAGMMMTAHGRLAADKPACLRTGSCKDAQLPPAADQARATKVPP